MELLSYLAVFALGVFGGWSVTYYILTEYYDARRASDVFKILREMDKTKK